VTNIRGQIQPLSASPQVKSWEETVAESHAGGGLNALIVDIKKVKGKVFPYSLPSVGPGADPGVQAVSPQVT